MEKVIKKLQDDKHYYGEFGLKYLSNSDIDALINNPYSFHQPKSQSFTVSVSADCPVAILPSSSIRTLTVAWASVPSVTAFT